MKIFTDIVNWLISSGTIVTVTVFAWRYLKPVLEAKKKQAKTAQERELLGLVESLAENVVTSLVGNTALTGQDKFKVATTAVGSALTNKGFDVSEETINHAVQAAYEKSYLTPTVNPDNQPKTGVVVDNG